MNKITLTIFFYLGILLCNIGAATIIFQDEFNTDTGWVLGFGNQGRPSGDYAGSSINTSGISDHSDIHFNEDGTEIAATNNFFKAINNGINSASSISQSISVTAGLTYNVYFRYTGSHSGSHTFNSTFTLGGDSATTGTLAAPSASWTSGSYSFSPTTSGNATLAFTDVNVPINSDLLLDSVVVAAVPEPSSAILLSLTSMMVFLGRKRHV